MFPSHDNCLLGPCFPVTIPLTVSQSRYSLLFPSHDRSGDVKGDGAKILTSLDAVGNTTKAITKGIAIATAVLAATALFGAFTDAIKNSVLDAGKNIADQALQFQGVLDVADPRNLVGLMIGASVVFLFSGLAVNAVSRAAGAVVMEILSYLPFAKRIQDK